MHTITPHLMQAAILAVRHLGAARPRPEAPKIPQALGVIAVGAVIVVLAFVAAMVRAARRFAGLIAELLQLATSLASSMLTVVIAVALFVVVLIRH